MAVKGVLHVGKLADGRYEVQGKATTSGLHLGYVQAKGKVFVVGEKSYPTLNHAVLALARGQNRRFSPRASFHQSRIIVTEESL